MTNEEAIDYIEKWKTDYSVDAKDREVLSMAIEVLKQQPSDDCISREAVLDTEYQIKEINGIEYVMLSEVQMKIRKMPSVTPKAEWIPVSEKKAHFPCLAVDKFGQIFIPQGIVTINNRCYDGTGFDFYVGKFKKGKEVIINGRKAYIEPKEVIAWRPLPEPYKAESEK